MLNTRGASLIDVCKARLAEGEPRWGVTARDRRAATRNLRGKILRLSGAVTSGYPSAAPWQGESEGRLPLGVACYASRLARCES